MTSYITIALVFLIMAIEMLRPVYLQKTFDEEDAVAFLKGQRIDVKDDVSLTESDFGVFVSPQFDFRLTISPNDMKRMMDSLKLSTHFVEPDTLTGDSPHPDCMKMDTVITYSYVYSGTYDGGVLNYEYHNNTSEILGVNHFNFTLLPERLELLFYGHEH